MRQSAKPNSNEGANAMTKIYVQAEYIAYCSLRFDLPNVKTWNDVEDWYVKYGHVNIKFKDGTLFDIELQDNETDYKRPMRTFVLSCDEDNEPNWTGDYLSLQE